ncbi:ankyrin repeat-containing protein [Anaeramoeba ignava]|uniref:Ankyrin repeat-containing protein n=1 Tax=Anaeramoeba ignava TaxID=1746090 RepID=A0A9Q0R8B6_ANAIG|nr:ankyrin repeat-containing protein [Anaeramoeba ignava]
MTDSSAFWSFHPLFEEKKVFTEEDVNQVDGNTPLHYIVCEASYGLLDYSENEHFTKLEQILKLTKNPNKTNGRTALHALCTYPDPVSIEILIKAGLDVNAKDGRTPLHLCCYSYGKNSKIDSLKKLLEKGAKVNALNTPLFSLFHSYRKPNMELIKILVEAGADLNIKNGINVFQRSCSMYTSLKFIEFLINSGAEVNTEFRTPLLSALSHDLNNEKKSQKKKKIIKLLLRKGANPFEIDGWSCLHYACRYSYGMKITEELISKGVDVNAKTMGWTPLTLACGFKPNYKMIKKLLESGAEVNIQNYNWTPLHYASRYSTDINVLILLLSNGGYLVSNSKKPEDYADSKEIKSFLSHFQTFSDEMRIIFEKEKETDMEIQVLNGSIKAHSLILKARLVDKVYSEFIEISKSKKKEIVQKFILWIYTGLSDLQDLSMIREYTEEIGISKEEFHKKNGKFGMAKDLSKLFQDPKTSDFKITCEEDSKEILVHRIMLIVRSDLFRGMFDSVKDDSKKVKDYSKRSFEALEIFFKFLYSDEIEFPINEIIAKELFDAPDFYQLEEKSMMNFYIEYRFPKIKKKCLIM